jgi:hypothetical protein
MERKKKTIGYMFSILYYLHFVGIFLEELFKRLAILNLLYTIFNIVTDAMSYVHSTKLTH